MINIHMPLKQFKAKKVEHAQYTKVLDIEMQINTYFTSLFFITTRYNLAVKKYNNSRYQGNHHNHTYT